MAEKDNAAVPKSTASRGRDAIDPGAHRDDMCSVRVWPKAVSSIASVACSLRQFDAAVSARAAGAIEPIVEACRKRAPAEAVRREIDRPQHDETSAAQPPRDEPAGTGQGIEAEPAVHAWRGKRDEGVEDEGQRRPQRQANRP